ncbi:molybdenum cofactor guanylyltransferase [Pararhizobium sp.]|uniref:molybdenum cofactor guanylyltransferase n=1 Tax=Pararhizobium sp. TaxID=1977563 RepID=UPI0027287BE6|nr:molybdenum cofactor guanylyltransferase [Pararhizobium sp.]MDO9418969.1 molybdenum cofactor guanylyltransferase [Pararhizobium sp.]
MIDTLPLIPAVVLAGGRSRRMGMDKADLVLGGQTLVARAVSRLTGQTAAVAVNMATRPQGLDAAVFVVPDPIGGHRGPLAGILAAMRYAQSLGRPAERVATVSVDSPFFPADLIQQLAQTVPDGQTIAIAACSGRDHPVFGLWPIALADELDDWVTHSADLSVRSFLRGRSVVEVDFEPLLLGGDSLDPFFNVNTPDDFEQARQIEEVLHP